jgi:hemerythrin
MGMIEWSESLVLGIDDIDKQHMKFLDFVNELLLAMKNKKSKDIQSEIIDKLISYAFYHFSKEERYLKKYNYPDTRKHQKEHEYFVDKIIQFKKDYDNHKITLSIDMINFMNNWWISHIKVSDKKYENYIQEKDKNSF